MLKPLLNAIGFQCGWFLCVLGAARGLPWLGPAAVLLLLAGHARLVEAPRRALQFVMLIGAYGLLVDSLLALGGVLAFKDGMGPGWICPPWLIALWMLFATTPALSLRWLYGRWALAAGLGAVFGPLSYYAGAALGAVTLGTTRMTGLLVLSLVWAVTLPLLLVGSERLSGSGHGS